MRRLRRPIGSPLVLLLVVGCFRDTASGEDGASEETGQGGTTTEDGPTTTGPTTTGPTTTEPTTTDDGSTTTDDGDGAATTDDGPTTTDDSDSGAEEAVVCGNGVEETGEECDDGNNVTEACAYAEMACTVCAEDCSEASGETSFCGDQEVDGQNGEECDDGNDNDHDGCRNDCSVPQPIIYLPFENSAVNEGTLGSAHDGIASNVTYSAGRIGFTAVAFGSDSGSSVTIPNTRTPLSSEATYTIAFWYREDEVKSLALYLLDFLETRGGLYVNHNNSASLNHRYAASPEGSDNVDVDYTVGSWHHLLYRCEGTSTEAPGGCDLEIYLDNALVSQLTTDGNVIFSAEQAQNMVLGQNTNFYVDDFKIYDSVFDLEGQCVHVIGGTWSGSSCTMP